MSKEYEKLITPGATKIIITFLLAFISLISLNRQRSHDGELLTIILLVFATIFLSIKLIIYIRTHNNRKHVIHNTNYFDLDHIVYFGWLYWEHKDKSIRNALKHLKWCIGESGTVYDLRGNDIYIRNFSNNVNVVLCVNLSGIRVICDDVTIKVYNIDLNLKWHLIFYDIKNKCLDFSMKIKDDPFKVSKRDV